MPESRFGPYGYFYFTLAFFLLSILGHFIFGWFSYVNEEADHRAAVDVSGYLVAMGRDVMENWQSEFLQLIWQVAGLAYLLHVGSPQSKEGDDRHEEKLDAILLALEPRKAKAIITRLDRKYRRQGKPDFDALK